MSSHRALVSASPTSLRPAGQPDVAAISKLVTSNVGWGHLLPRSADDIQQHVPRFLVATRGSLVVGCGELAPLSNSLSEVRSLVVAADARGGGIGTGILASRDASKTCRVCALSLTSPIPSLRLAFRSCRTPGFQRRS